MGTGEKKNFWGEIMKKTTIAKVIITILLFAWGILAYMEKPPLSETYCGTYNCTIPLCAWSWETGAAWLAVLMIVIWVLPWALETQKKQESELIGQE